MIGASYIRYNGLQWFVEIDADELLTVGMMSVRSTYIYVGLDPRGFDFEATQPRRDARYFRAEMDVSPP